MLWDRNTTFVLLRSILESGVRDVRSGLGPLLPSVLHSHADGFLMSCRKIACYPHGKASLPGNLLPGNSDKPPARMTQWLVLTNPTENRSTLSSSFAVVRKLWSQSPRGYRTQTSSFLSSRRSYRPHIDSLMESPLCLKM